VGSITLNTEFTSTFRSSETAAATGIDELLERMEREEFDLVAIGRSLIVNPPGRKSFDAERSTNCCPTSGRINSVDIERS